MTTPTTTQATATDRAAPAFTSGQYHWLIDAGILTTEDRVELIGGQISNMPPMGDDHNDSIDYVNTWLVDRRERRYIARCQSTIRLAEGFSPDPDFVLLRYHPGGYGPHRQPEISDVLLVIEVADSSLHRDLGAKALAYARAGVPELWVVDLPHRQIHVFINPSPDGYRDHATAGESESVTSLLIDGLTMPVQAALEFQAE